MTRSPDPRRRGKASSSAQPGSMNVGFIGLGRIGRGMARNLLRSGARLVVFDQNADAAKPLIDSGAEWAASVGALARQASVIFTSLPGPSQVEEVVLGSGGIAQNMRT